MKTTTVILALLLSGCANQPLANRIACTVAGDKALVASMYGWSGFVSEVDQRDAAVMCRPKG